MSHFWHISIVFEHKIEKPRNCFWNQNQGKLVTCLMIIKSSTRIAGDINLFCIKTIEKVESNTELICYQFVISMTTVERQNCFSFKVREVVTMSDRLLWAVKDAINKVLTRLDFIFQLSPTRRCPENCFNYGGYKWNESMRKRPCAVYWNVDTGKDYSQSVKVTKTLFIVPRWKKSYTEVYHDKAYLVV